MALDQSYIGRVYPPSRPYEVSREKIREFAEAIGDDTPAYRDPQAAATLGYADVIAPPTFLIVLASRVAAQVVFDPDLGLDYSRVVHGEQRFVHLRPARAGDRLVGVLTVDNIRVAAGNDIISSRVELATEAGEPVATAYSTLVARAPAESAEPKA